MISELIDKLDVYFLKEENLQLRNKIIELENENRKLLRESAELFQQITFNIVDKIIK